MIKICITTRLDEQNSSLVCLVNLQLHPRFCLKTMKPFSPIGSFPASFFQLPISYVSLCPPHLACLTTKQNLKEKKNNKTLSISITRKPNGLGWFLGLFGGSCWWQLVDSDWGGSLAACLNDIEGLGLIGRPSYTVGMPVGNWHDGSSVYQSILKLLLPQL